MIRQLPGQLYFAAKGHLDAATVTSQITAHMAGNKVLCTHCDSFLAPSTVYRHQSRQQRLELEESLRDDPQSDDENKQENNDHGHDDASFIDVDDPVDRSSSPNNQFPRSPPPEGHNNPVAPDNNLEDNPPGNRLGANDGWFDPYLDEDEDNIPHAIDDDALDVEWDSSDDEDDQMSDLGHLIDDMDQEQHAREMYELGMNVCHLPLFYED